MMMEETRHMQVNETAKNFRGKGAERVKERERGREGVQDETREMGARPFVRTRALAFFFFERGRDANHGVCVSFESNCCNRPAE